MIELNKPARMNLQTRKKTGVQELSPLYSGVTQSALPALPRISLPISAAVGSDLHYE
jgi:hypothetical protein